MLSGHIRPMSGSFGHLPAHYVRLASHNNGFAVKLGLRISRAMARGISFLSAQWLVGDGRNGDASRTERERSASLYRFSGVGGYGILWASGRSRRIGILHRALQDTLAVYLRTAGGQTQAPPTRGA